MTSIDCMATPQLDTILTNYKKLCDYCDQIWSQASQTYPQEIACTKGCGICCELQSVNRLEAHIIRTYLSTNPHRATSLTPDKFTCPFLLEDSCRIYNARPLICRTHGLVFRSREFALQAAPSCPYNFNSHYPTELPQDCTLDIDVITDNLMRLNLAFCMITGRQQKSEERIKLWELIDKKVE